MQLPGLSVGYKRRRRRQCRAGDAELQMSRFSNIMSKAALKWSE